MPEDGAGPEDKKGVSADVVKAEKHGNNAVLAELDSNPRWHGHC
jgi:hypothetical protein